MRLSRPWASLVPERHPGKGHLAARLTTWSLPTLLPDDLIQLTAMCWMREFIQLAGRVMLPYSSGILTAVLPCLAYDDRKKSIFCSGREETTAAPAGGTLECKWGLH